MPTALYRFEDGKIAECWLLPEDQAVFDEIGARLTEAILATVFVVHGELLGEPSAELRAKLAGSEVRVLFTPFQSM